MNLLKFVNQKQAPVIKKRGHKPGVPITKLFIDRPWLGDSLSEREIITLGKIISLKGGINFKVAARELGLTYGNSANTQGQILKIALKFIYQHINDGETN